jgi:hypothetical protein
MSIETQFVTESELTAMASLVALLNQVETETLFKDVTFEIAVGDCNGEDLGTIGWRGNKYVYLPPGPEG